MDELGFHRALHRPGTLLDVGAHDGLLTLPLAALPASHVLAFEPLPSAFARLTAACAGLRNVALHQAALGDHEGTATLTLPVLDGVPQEQWASTAKGYAGLDARVTEQTLEVPLARVDSLGVTDLTAIKLDAEGAEYEVLRGARRTLLRCRPVLSVEVEERHRAGSTWSVPAFLDALGYDGFYEHQGRWTPLGAFDRASMQRASRNPADFTVSDPYIFVFYFLPHEDCASMLATLRATERGTTA